QAWFQDQGRVRDGAIRRAIAVKRTDVTIRPRTGKSHDHVSGTVYGQRWKVVIVGSRAAAVENPSVRQGKKVPVGIGGDFQPLGRGAIHIGASHTSAVCPVGAGKPDVLAGPQSAIVGESHHQTASRLVKVD